MIAEKFKSSRTLDRASYPLDPSLRVAAASTT
jgi:hypothetical protein